MQKDRITHGDIFRPYMPPVVLSVVLLDTQSIVIASSSGYKIHPCRTPVSTGNHWLISSSVLTTLLLSSYSFWMMRRFSLVFHSVQGSSTVLVYEHYQSLRKSTKLTATICRYIWRPSVMVLSVGPIIKVNQHPAWLVLGCETVFGHLGMSPATFTFTSDLTMI